ncbi:hypothetical protein C8R45DRAFT_936488 [Mycena sanguinolenta]|nr:hypothetical protein C8R45DRAFT_936488 [Mycena sanguinolenta]
MLTTSSLASHLRTNNSSEPSLVTARGLESLGEEHHSVQGPRWTNGKLCTDVNPIVLHAAVITYQMSKIHCSPSSARVHMRTLPGVGEETNYNDGLWNLSAFIVSATIGCRKLIWDSVYRCSLDARRGASEEVNVGCGREAKYFKLHQIYRASLLDLAANNEDWEYAGYIRQQSAAEERDDEREKDDERGQRTVRPPTSAGAEINAFYEVLKRNSGEIDTIYRALGGGVELVGAEVAGAELEGKDARCKRWLLRCQNIAVEGGLCLRRR